MKLVIALVSLAAGAFAADSRNTYTPNTDTHFAVPKYNTLAEWETRKAQLRRQILFAAGLDPMPAKTPLHAQIFGRLQTRDCTIEKVLIETLPGYYLGGNLYRPLDGAVKHPAVLNPHGHWTYGRLENQPLYSGPQFGANLARLGYVVFAFDMVGYNDSAQTPHIFGAGPAERAWSFGPMQLQSWNSIRALDFLESLADVDASRIGVAGASGGATQSIVLSALDERIKFAAPVNMVSAFMQGGDYCENAPGLRVGTNNVEFAAIIAPRPLLLVSATGDWTRNTAVEEYPAIRAIYALYGKADNVTTLQLDAPHNFNKANREAVYRFVTGQPSIVEKDAEVPKLQEMLALYGRALPTGALSYAQIFETWKNRPTGSKDNARRRLQSALGAEWPERVVANGATLSRPSVGDAIPYRFVEGTGVPVLVVNGRVEDAPAGRPVLSIEVFQTGSAVAPRDKSARHFLTFNRTDDQCRVQDVVTALAWLHAKHAGPIEVIAAGNWSALVPYAQAVAPIEVLFRGNPGLQPLDVPGLELALRF